MLPVAYQAACHWPLQSDDADRYFAMRILPTFLSCFLLAIARRYRRLQSVAVGMTCRP
jgi:hypothetical protein